MDGVEPEGEQLLGGEEVAQVGAGEGSTSIAGTFVVGGPRVAGVARRLDLQPAGAGEEQPVAGDAGGKDAVEQVDARHRAAQQILRRADAHEVARLVRGQERRRVLDAFPHPGRLLADGEAAQRAAGKIQLGDLRRVARAQVLVQPALDDAEEVARPCETLPFVLAALLPAGGPGHRLFVVGAVGSRGRALVEGHQDVAAELGLDLHRPLRRQLLLAAVDVAAEDGALFGDLPLVGERVHLEAARVGQDVLVPRHELAEAAHLDHHLGAGAQEQVVGVAEDDLRADGVQVVRRDALHRGDRAHRHELRRVDHAVGQLEPAAAGGTVGVRDCILHIINIASP